MNNLSPLRLTPFAPAPPILSSRERNWPGVVISEHRQGPHHWHVPPLDDHLVLLVLDRSAGRIRHERGGHAFEGRPGVGSLAVVPQGVAGHCHCHASIEALHIRLAPEFVARVAEENFHGARFHLATRLGLRDEPLSQLALLLRAELRSEGAGGALMAQSLAHAVAVLLLRSHAHFHARNSEPCEKCGGLSGRALRRVQELVRERLAHDLSLDDMAQAAGVSRFHFARSFKQSTGLAPYQYVLAQRVERAKQLLIKGRLPLREIAQATGFADQSHLTRHFRRLAGTTPRAFQGLQVLAPAESEQEPSKNQS